MPPHGAPEIVSSFWEIYTLLRLIQSKKALFPIEFTLDPIEKDCDCYACKNYSKSYIRHLLVADETFGQRLISIHNIRFLTKLMEDIRTHIEADDLLEFREEFASRYNKKKNE